jgi:hypothetical protein
MSSRPQSKRTKDPDEDSQIKQLIKERSELNEGLNSLLKKITKPTKGKKTHNL